MSYTRSYSETIYKVVSKNVHYNYPASENGGSDSVYVEMEAVVPVDINIRVDTHPFDRSVEHCSNTVNLLTGAIVATEAAEIASIKKNSKLVADTIIGGFFSYIRSEISQQISELTQKIDAQLMHLRELMQSCRSKKIQMEGDYHRISSRYVKIFEDLNKELSNRIFEMDRSAFAFKKETDNQKIRSTDNDMVNLVAIFGSDSGDLQSKISASIAKKRAYDTINKARLFLWQQKSLSSTIQQSMLNESVSGTIFTPVCFLETRNKNNQIEKSVFTTNYLSALNGKNQKNDLTELFSSNTVSWGRITPEDKNSIDLYFNTELNSKTLANDRHAVRVREMIQKIATLGSISAINLR